MASRSPGRPREFDRSQALHVAVDLFWRNGYGATSLDDLTQAMGIGRSSFYGTFVSKHAVLLEALERYTGELVSRLDAAAQKQKEPGRAILAILEIVACTEQPDRGCLFVNSASELLPDDAEVLELARRYLGKVDKLVAGLLRRVGFSAPEARHRSGAMLALATGAVTLRKAGEPAARIRAMLDLLPALMSRRMEVSPLQEQAGRPKHRGGRKPAK